MHTATLLHDDVVDESDLRRGKLGGPHALGQPGERARRRLPARPGLQDDGGGRLARRARHPLERRRRDCRGRGDAARPPPRTPRRRGRPTSPWSAARRRSCSPPPRGRPGDRRRRSGRTRRLLAAYGLNLGLAFQLVDDALDYGGSSQKLGKNVGDDFREGKITLPVVLERAQHYAKMAKDALGLFPASAMKQALNETVDFCVARAH
jgi:octaprenyl-diphosphate synthase